jgi:hypothetical protein
MSDNENPAIAQIINSEVVYQHFGYWPDFHDAEITKVTFESHPGYRATVIFSIAAFEMTSETDERGFYKLTKQCQIQFQFTGIKEMEFDYFSHQNVVLDLSFEKNNGAIQCTFNSSVGLDGVIVAEEAMVLSLIPTKR